MYNYPPLGTFRRPVPSALWWSWGGGRFLMSQELLGFEHRHTHIALWPCGRAPDERSITLQGYLAHKKVQPPRTLEKAYAYGPVPILGGGAVSYEQGTPVGLPTSVSSH
jgi:hypothetical protein